MDQQKLNEILELHGLWLEGEGNGQRANLTGANLTDANLMRANLTGANLTGANLTGANLTGAVGERKRIMSLFVCEQYPITYTSKVLQIGCQRHTFDQWWSFDDKQILEMDGKNALRFWREYKDFIRSVIEKCPAR